MKARLLALTIAMLPGSVWAANPLSGLLRNVFNPSPASARDLALQEKHGPWLVMAASFNGPGAQASAEELALELRGRYRMDAYVHAQGIELDQDLPVGVDQYGQPRKFKYANVEGGAIEGAVVLVGHFDAVDSPKAQRQRDRIKYEVHPECLTNSPQAKQSLALAALRSMHRKFLPDDHENQSKGPLGHAFVVPNPLLPTEYFAPQGVDKFVERMNRDVEYSLLDAPGEYTVRVATFRGLSKIGDRDDSGRDDESESQLAKAAEKAHLLVEALRARGWEAYEFHDRDESLVTIGAFDDAKEYAEGRFAPSTPDAVRAIRTFAATQSQYNVQAAQLLNRVGRGPTGLNIQPKTLIGIYGAQPGRPLARGDKIPFDVQPEVVRTPRRSLAADYRRRIR